MFRETSFPADVFDEIRTLPILLIRERALANNITEMSAFCARYGLELAPHCKTHMSPDLWRRQAAKGARRATVATAAQAGIFFDAGVRSLLIANQVVAPGDIAELNRLLRGGADILVFVDSVASVTILTEHLALTRGQLGVLVEYGVPGFRTGCRTFAEVSDVVDAVRGSSCLVLRGLAGYEGVLSRAVAVDEQERLLSVYMERTATVLDRLTAQYRGDQPFIVSFGGSDLYPAVVEALADRTYSVPIRILLRSGCYLVHDHGKYARAQESVPSAVTKPHFLAALEVWAPVTSVPERGLAVVGLGARHVSHDTDLPTPLTIRRDGRHVPVRDAKVVALYDQHAVLRTGDRSDLRVGDLVSMGISHPCTTFDKWRSAIVVDEDYRPVETIRTHFG
ncbi:amino acid deaminase [Rhodococcus qingshengii]|uniref:amino acid deaminase n=1 Tax=Rhodococcus qingshengii TaxID=334542 RepID=UPI00237D18CE|nr:amino acid deaminase [Rhodococcus qingshengii]WCT05986.1 amino acid deaminase [Rhodococcus qingshengii]